jgi:hypothetical protein
VTFACAKDVWIYQLDVETLQRLAVACARLATMSKLSAAPAKGLLPWQSTPVTRTVTLPFGKVSICARWRHAPHHE